MMFPFELSTTTNSDSRGVLVACEVSKITNVTFERFFIISDVIGGIRGGHAHKFTHQIIHCLSGSFLLSTEYNRSVCDFHMNKSSSPVFTPALTWVDMTNISSDCKILVLSSDEYNISNSLRNYDDYCEYISSLSI